MAKKILTGDIIPLLKAQIVTKAEFETTIGDIDTILREINGEPTGGTV